MIQSRYRLLWLLLLVGYITSCTTSSTTDPKPTTTNQYLVSSTAVGDFTREQLVARTSALGPLYGALVQQGIKVRRLVYKTKNWDGTEISASGLVILPAATPTAVPMISQQHGTIFAEADAPSNYGPNTEAYLFSSLFASIGYIMVCPDYIGFGESKNVPHPYEHRATLASSCLDMIRAAREYIKSDATIQWDNRLYLTGYSAGGTATMSLYKKIQDEAPTEFNLRAVSCGAGAYDKTNFTIALLSKPSSGSVDANRTFIWVLLTYNDIYKLNRPLSYYFKEPYLTEVQAKKQLATINVSLDQTFTDTFKKGVLDGTDTALLKALADNDVYDWKPLTPLRLYHGDADTQVFFLNSQNAYNAMQKRGAGSTVTLVPVPGQTHLGAIQTWIFGTYDMFTTTR